MFSANEPLELQLTPPAPQPYTGIVIQLIWGDFWSPIYQQVHFSVWGFICEDRASGVWQRKFNSCSQRHFATFTNLTVKKLKNSTSAGIQETQQVTEKL